jgi:hypothetical protein
LCLSKNGCRLTYRLADTFGWSSAVFSPVLDAIEHGSVLEHVRKNDKDNLGSSHVNLRTLPFDTVNISNDGILDVQVHLIFRLEQQTPNQLSRLRFDFHDRPFRIVQNDNGNSDTVISDYRHDQLQYNDMRYGIR